MFAAMGNESPEKISLYVWWKLKPARSINCRKTCLKSFCIESCNGAYGELQQHDTICWLYESNPVDDIRAWNTTGEVLLHLQRSIINDRSRQTWQHVFMFLKPVKRARSGLKREMASCWQTLNETGLREKRNILFIGLFASKQHPYFLISINLFEAAFKCREISRLRRVRKIRNALYSNEFVKRYYFYTCDRKP